MTRLSELFCLLFLQGALVLPLAGQMRLRVQSIDPVRASVAINGTPGGETPLTVAVGEGINEVQVGSTTHCLYVPPGSTFGRLSVSGARMLTVEGVLECSSAAATVTLTGVSGLDVQVSGATYRSGIWTVRDPSRPVEVSLRHPEGTYVPRSFTLALNAGDSVVVDPRMGRPMPSLQRPRKPLGLPQPPTAARYGAVIPTAPPPPIPQNVSAARELSASIAAYRQRQSRRSTMTKVGYGFSALLGAAAFYAMNPEEPAKALGGIPAGFFIFGMLGVPRLFAGGEPVPPRACGTEALERCLIAATDEATYPERYPALQERYEAEMRVYEAGRARFLEDQSRLRAGWELARDSVTSLNEEIEREQKEYDAAVEAWRRAVISARGDPEVRRLRRGGS